MTPLLLSLELSDGACTTTDNLYRSLMCIVTCVVEKLQGVLCQLKPMTKTNMFSEFQRNPSGASLASQRVWGKWSGDYCQHSVDSAGMLALPIRLQHLPIIALMKNIIPGALRG